jgi:hypothetical protein
LGGHLRKITAAVPATGNPDAVLAHLDLVDAGDLSKRREDRDLDLHFTQLLFL